MALTLALTLGGCSWQGSLLGGGGPSIIQAPPGEHIVGATTSGALIEEPDTPPTDTVERALGQTQRIRTYVRQLAR